MTANESPFWIFTLVVPVAGPEKSAGGKILRTITKLASNKTAHIKATTMGALLRLATMFESSSVLTLLGYLYCSGISVPANASVRFSIASASSKISTAAA